MSAAVKQDLAAELAAARAQVDGLRQKLASLYAVMETASGFEDLAVALTRSLERVLAATSAERGFVHLLGRQRQHLHLLCHNGLDEAARRHLEKIRVVDSPLFKPLFRAPAPLLIPDMAADPRSAALHRPGAAEQLLLVAISGGGARLGALGIIARAPAAFLPEEVGLLLALGEQMGLTVENARLRRQMAELALVEERSRLARELHDSVTQSLYSATLFAEAARRLAASGDLEQTRALLEEVSLTTQQALKEMRLLVHKLRPSILAQEGLAAAIRHRLQSVEGRAGIRHELVATALPRFSHRLEDAAFFIIQEALNNALRHAMARHVRVDLAGAKPAGLRLTVRDDGQGFDPGAVDNGGYGLTSMRERAAALRGALQIDSSPGAGTVVQTTLYEPAREEQDEDSGDWENWS